MRPIKDSLITEKSFKSDFANKRAFRIRPQNEDWHPTSLSEQE